MPRITAPGRRGQLLPGRLREGRERFAPPQMSAAAFGPEYGTIWFPTAGCRWDFRGECTMCNYGHPLRVAPERMVEAVRRGLEYLRGQVGRVPRIVWVSAFNVLDDIEVPPHARRAIYELLAETEAELVLSETHPETVTVEKVRECVGLLRGKKFGVEIGLESLDDFVRFCCIHKRLARPRLCQALADVRCAGALSYINLLIGAPFLAPCEVVRDATSSVLEAFELGADRVVLFPAHVKPHTLVDWLHQRGLYHPPSLWALIDVLANLPADLLPRVFDAWTEPVDHPGRCESIAPALGQDVSAQVHAHLRRYLATRDPSALRWLFDCRSPCREAWEERRRADPAEPLLQRMRTAYARIGSEVMGEWWGSHGSAVLADLEAAWARRKASPHDPGAQS